MREYAEITHHFGKALRVKRQQADLSQEKLAELAGVANSYISMLEQGQRQPTITTLFQLSDALGIQPNEFICIIDKEVPLK